jgi:hypothetical protein
LLIKPWNSIEEMLLSPGIRFPRRNSGWAIILEAAARHWADWKSRGKSVTASRQGLFLKTGAQPAKF